MLSYCLKCKEKQNSKNPSVVVYMVCGCNKSRQKEASGILNSLTKSFSKMSEIIEKFLLAGDKFIPKMHLRQPYMLCKPEFTYSAFGSSTKNKEKS